MENVCEKFTINTLVTTLHKHICGVKSDKHSESERIVPLCIQPPVVFNGTAVFGTCVPVFTIDFRNRRYRQNVN